MNECKHTKGFRFLSCVCADRLPGVWACVEDCGFTSRTDPNNPYPKGIRYLDGPNPKATKVIVLVASKKG